MKKFLHVLIILGTISASISTSAYAEEFCYNFESATIDGDYFEISFKSEPGQISGERISMNSSISRKTLRAIESAPKSFTHFCYAGPCIDMDLSGICHSLYIKKVFMKP